MEFFFVYTREAHPGDQLGAHSSYEDKVNAAELLRQQEGVDIPIIVDELSGNIHRKYGKLPNPTFIIDKAGRIAFRSLGTRASVIHAALDELLEVQQEEGKDHAIVCDGEDLHCPRCRYCGARIARWSGAASAASPISVGKWDFRVDGLFL